MDSLIIQSIGFVGMLFFMASMQMKNRYYLLLLQIFGHIAFSVHFYLLSATAASVINIVGIFRALLFQKKETSGWAKKSFWLPCFILLYVLSGILFWNGPIAILAIVATALETRALWSSDPQAIRKRMILPRLGWLTHNFVVGSIAGVISDVFYLISVLVGIWRFKKAEKNS